MERELVNLSINMHLHFINMVLKVSFARKLFSTLVAFARNFKISVPKIEYQHARALSYGSQGFICKEIIFHIGCNCQQLSNQRAENIVNIHVHCSLRSYGSPGYRFVS